MQTDQLAARQLLGQLTSLRPKGPISEALLSRRLLSLPAPAREALASMLAYETVRRGAPPISSEVFRGVARALVEYPEATASEVTRVQQAGAVMATDARERLFDQRFQLVRLAQETVHECRRSRQRIHPIATDRHCLAQMALQHTAATAEELSDMCGVQVRKTEGAGALLTQHGFAVGARIATVVLASKPPGDVAVCQSCLGPIGFTNAASCPDCCDFLCCSQCSSDAAAQKAHGFECSRTQAIVRQTCKEATAHLGPGPTQVTVLELAKGVIVPVHVGSASDTSIPSSVIGRLLRAPIGAELVNLYARLVARHLSDPDLEPPAAACNLDGSPIFGGVLERIMTTHRELSATPPRPAGKSALRRQRRRAARRIQRAARHWLALLRQRDAAPTGLAARAAPTADPSCVVCLDRPRTIVVLPCRHLSMCEACAAGMALCPMCRGGVREAMPVFV